MTWNFAFNVLQVSPGEIKMKYLIFLIPIFVISCSSLQKRVEVNAEFSKPLVPTLTNGSDGQSHYQITVDGAVLHLSFSHGSRLEIYGPPLIPILPMAWGAKSLLVYTGIDPVDKVVLIKPNESYISMEENSDVKYSGAFSGLNKVTPPYPKEFSFDRKEPITFDIKFVVPEEPEVIYLHINGIYLNGKALRPVTVKLVRSIDWKYLPLMGPGY